MKGIGIVFAGGGGKGAYEIGVWKYLHELGLEQYVRVVSGTSVGALNAALFVGSSYETAENLWLNVEPQKILTPKKISTKEIISWLGLEMKNPILNKIGKMTSVVASETIFGVEKLAQLTLMKMRTEYLFSRDGLIAMISNGLNFGQLQNSDIPCFATCLHCPDLKVERFKLNDFDEEYITKVLLASSAIPVVFSNEELAGKKYCDGGVPVVGDNVPIKPVYDTGVENIIVVHLSQETLVDKSRYGNSRIIEIVPSDNLGDAVTGTLDFTPEGAERRIQMGYADAKNIMQPMLEMLLLNVENQRMLKTAKQKNLEFGQKRMKLLEEEKTIKQAMTTDGFDNVFNELTKE